MSNYGKDWTRFLDEEGEDAWKYDFRFEAEGWARDKSEAIKEAVSKFVSITDDDISRTIEYKASGIGFDPDDSNCTCDLSRSIYEAIWKDLFRSMQNENETPTLKGVPKEFIKQWHNLGLGVSSDTMHTFKTTYNQALIIYAMKITEMGEKEFSEKYFRKFESRNGQQWWGWNYDAIRQDIPNLEESVHSNKLLRKFAGLSQTIGSFALIPRKIQLKNSEGVALCPRPYFQSRGISKHLKDYWDLSLDALKTTLRLMSQEFGDALFKGYVDMFQLKEYYVDENYNVINLFTRKTKPESPFPWSCDELDEYLENVNTKIEARGKGLITLLHEERNRVHDTIELK